MAKNTDQPKKEDILSAILALMEQNSNDITILRKLNEALLQNVGTEKTQIPLNTEGLEKIVSFHLRKSNEVISSQINEAKKAEDSLKMVLDNKISKLNEIVNHIQVESQNKDSRKDSVSLSTLVLFFMTVISIVIAVVFAIRNSTNENLYTETLGKYTRQSEHFYNYLMDKKQLESYKEWNKRKRRSKRK